MPKQFMALFMDFLPCLFTNVSYVMEFLAWWVLKSHVKWNYCILWIDIAWGLQKLGLILENKMF